MRWALMVGLAVGLVAAAAAADPAKDPGAAAALFKTGREMAEKGEWAGACPKFEASLALMPSASTQLNLAQCQERVGKLTLAWFGYQRALVLNRETQGDDRRRALEEVAQRSIRALEPRLPKLRVTVVDAPAGLRVTRDGDVLPAASLGEALPIDPGTHVLEAAAAGRRPARREVTITEGQALDVELALEAAPAQLALAPVARDTRGTVRAPDGSDGAGRVPPWVWVSGGAGLALGGAAVAFLIDRASARSELDAHCQDRGDRLACDARFPETAELPARANRDLALSIGLGAAGVAALAAAAVGLATAPSARPAARVGATAWVRPGAAGASFAGSL